MMWFLGAVASSYRKAVLAAFDTTGGNDALRRHAFYSTYTSPFERFIHLFSAAYLLGFIASLIVINIQWIIDLPIKMTKVALEDRTVSSYNPYLGIAQFVFGFPGMVVGFAIGLFPMTGIYVMRFIKNTWSSMLWTVNTMMNMALAREDELRFSRLSPADHNISHILGYPVGFVIGLVASIIILVGRGALSVARGIRTVVLDSIISLVGISVRMMNTVLAVEDRIQSPNQEDQFKLTGILGFLLGVAVGLVGAGIIGVGRCFLNAIRTARELSGGILNVAFKREIFVGLAHHRAVNARWGWGLPGVLLAIPVGFVAVGISAVRKLPLLIRIALSPVVMIFRLLHESYKYMTDDLRFSKKTPRTEHEVEQPIAQNSKNLLKAFFAGLTLSGELPVGKQVSSSKEGPTYYGSIKNTMSWSSFQKLLRKSVTLNQRSLTEMVLHGIYEGLVSAFDKQPDNGVDVNEVILHAIAKVKLTYQADSTLITPQSEKKRNDEEVDKIADYVRNILVNQNLERPVPAIYHENVARHLFFSRHIVEPVDDDVPVATPVVV